MCGIAATWGTPSTALVNLLAARMTHRGPDGSGHTVNPQSDVSFAHRRLSIIDPDGGQQPLQSKDKQATLVANGMIYNDLSLRDTLGHTNFVTGSDSESILNACLDDGPAGVEKLDGMFAFVMATQGKLIAARDPIGIKPLYIGLRDDGYCFASEIKALDPYVDEIREFPPGHVFDSSQGLQQYYSLPASSNDIGDADTAISIIQKTLTAAIEKRLRSDVPLGVFLSGGLDSSIIAAVANRFRPGLKSFSVGVADSPDLKAARQVADYLGTDHHEYIVTQAEVERDLPNILYHLESYDADLVQSAIPCYYVSRLAAAHVKVVLTGEGADELFAGYDYHKDYGHPEALQAELRRSVLTMHNINLQRVDRMTMAHGLEARVPFLDRSVLDMAFRIPVSLKLPENNRIEKWILCKAFAHMLLQDIVWRDKSQFDQGSGVKDILVRAGPANSHSRNPEMQVADARSASEAVYRTSLLDQFDNRDALSGLVAHWDSTARVDDRPHQEVASVTELSGRSSRTTVPTDRPNDDFSALYNLQKPQPYFRKMKQLDYQIPATAHRIFKKCIEEILRIRGESTLTVLDLCAGYGINGALLKSERSLEQLYAYFGDDKRATAGDPFFDRLSLGTERPDQNVRVVGLDVAANALNYGCAAGFMDEVYCADLEKQPIPSALAATIGTCSLITITGGFSFIGAKTFEKILAQTEKSDSIKPWVVGFPLLHTKLADLLSVLNSHGYTVQPMLQNRLRQRRFTNRTEQQREMDALQSANLGSFDEDYFESHLLLAQPPGAPYFRLDPENELTPGTREIAG